MKGRLAIQQFELELSGGSGRVITASGQGAGAMRAAMGIVGSAIAKPLARRTDPVTSQAAAARVIEFRGEHEIKIGEWLTARKLTGGTKDEIAAGTGLTPIAVARRIADMRAHAGVYDSGETRPTPSGRRATVWKIR
jgi:hypothetical protein